LYRERERERERVGRGQKKIREHFCRNLLVFEIQIAEN